MCKDFINLLAGYKKGEGVKLNVILIIFDTKKYWCDELYNILKEECKKNSDLTEVINEIKRKRYFRDRFGYSYEKSSIRDVTPIPGLCIFDKNAKKENRPAKKSDTRSEIKPNNPIHKQEMPKKSFEISQKKLTEQKSIPKPKTQKIKKEKPIERLIRKLKKILYKPIQCKICAIRFDTQESEALSVHLQDHQRKLRTSEQHTTVSREYACRESEWLVSKISLPTVSFSNTKVMSDKAQECKICKEKIQLKYDDEEEAWILNEGFKSEDGFYFHRKCIE